MLITHGTLVTYDESMGILADGAVLIQNGKVAAVGKTRDLIEQYPTEEQIDARGQFVMPGNVCAHTHFYGAYARGLAIPGEAPKDFPEILRHLWWNLDRALDKDTIRASALVCLVDAIKHGTTTLFDHHASPNYIEGSLDVIADAVEQSGLRSVLCYEVTDRNGPEGAEAGIAENVRFIKKSAGNPRVRATFGLHASLTLSDETLKKCVDAHPGKGFHIHVAEHEVDEEDSFAKYGKRVVHRLAGLGILSDRTIAAHCVHIGQVEYKTLQKYEVAITHQPRSNMNNAVGAMRFDKFMAEDAFVCLGNDGFSNAMWEEWKTAYFLHKTSPTRDPRRGNGAWIERAGHGNNQYLASMFFDDLPMGSIRPGAAADLIFVDYQPFTPITPENLPWHIIFGFESSMVTTTIVAGKLLMRDRRLLTLDAAAIAEEARALAPVVWARFNGYASELWSSDARG